MSVDIRIALIGLALCVGCAKGPQVEAAQAEASRRREEAPAPSHATPQPTAPPIELPSTYEEPPKDVVDIVDAPATPHVLVSPRRDRVLLAHYDALPSIEDVAAPYERLAGLRIDAKRYAERRTRMYERLELVETATGETRSVELPTGVRMGSPSWSPDGRFVAFTRRQDDGLRLWVVDAATTKAKQISDARIDDVLTQGFAWLPGGVGLVLFTVPNDGPQSPVRPLRPVGPAVSDTAGEKATNRTYQDLLEDPYDEALFEHLVTVQLLEVDLVTGTERPIGAPGMYTSVEPAPGGEFLLVEQIRRPFSYAVPFYRFPSRVEVWDRHAKVMRTVADLPLAEEIPIGGVRQGPRQVQWHPQRPGTLVWVEALDEGDPKKEVEHRDRVLQHEAPFDDVPKVLTAVEQRLTELAWTDQPEQYLVSDYDRYRRWTRTIVRDAGGERVLVDRSVRDAYADPGQPVYEQRADGSWVIPVEDGSILLSGSGATPEGYRPFLQRMSLQDGETQRLFESVEDEFASFVDHAAGGELLIWRE